jgi:2,3-diaminopropionate biosynthesis protein SbnA
MIISKLTDIKSQPLFYRIKDFINGVACYVKLEGCNIAGSLKLKSAIRMLNSLEKKGIVGRKSIIVCSSSGNLGVALSIICKEKGYPFICVSDNNILPTNESYIKLWGGELIKVSQRDENGGYLATRIRLIEKMLYENPNYIFVNQYADEENCWAHYLTTAQEIYQNFQVVNYLFVGAGTTGTLNGCASFFKKFSIETKIIAVDAEGSVTFDAKSAKRYIPGLGTSLKPQLATTEKIDDVIWVSEKNTIRMCRHLLQEYGLFLGGSSGTVLHGLYEYRSKIPKGSVVIAVSPDNGDRYIETVYNDEWVIKNFGSDVLLPNYCFDKERK